MLSGFVIIKPRAVRERRERVVEKEFNRWISFTQ
jgi:hypothetical protein